MGKGPLYAALIIIIITLGAGYVLKVKAEQVVQSRIKSSELIGKFD